MDFDGVNDYVGNGTPATFSEFTISAWFNSSSLYNDDDVEDRIFSFADPRIEVGLQDNSVTGDDGKLWIYDEREGTPSGLTFSTANLYDDSWHHVALTKLGMIRTIYLDGSLVGTWSAVDGSYGDGTFNIGTWIGGPGSDAEFKGQIDEVAFFDKAITASEIASNFECKLSGLEANLSAFYPFENGIPDADNTAITTTPTHAPPGGMGDGSLNGFALMGSSSNFVCPAVTFLGGPCILNCGIECDTSVLNLSTGYNVDGDAITLGQHTSKWRVVGTPAGSGVNPGLFPYILYTPSAWTDIPGAQYISPFDIIDNSFDNIATGTSFDFETCFCVCEDNSSITIDLSAYADNALNLDLYDNSVVNSGVFIMDLLDISDTEGTGAFNGPTFDDTHVLTLDAGQYCMKAALQNDGSRYMGLSINASVTGAGLIKSDCCGYSTNGITGYVYDDKNCNGNYNINSDGLLPGIEVVLCDSGGVEIESTMTDILGLYTFSDLPSGMYSVKHTAVPDYELTESPMVPFSLGATEVLGGLNFGLNNTGAITTEDFTSTCIQAGGSFTFNWCGQSCDCTIQVETRPCGSSGEFELIGSVPNNREFTWSVPSMYSGDYEFQIVDCDGNIIPFSSCLTIRDLDLDIQVVQTGCGIFDFSSTLTGASTPVNSYWWEFGEYLNSTTASPTQDFPITGTYQVCLTVITNDGCEVKICQDLEVTEGSEEDCNFCTPNILGEIDGGDLFIQNDKFGVIIQSPNGGCFRITVKNDGSLVTQPVECP